MYLPENILPDVALKDLEFDKIYWILELFALQNGNEPFQNKVFG